LKYTFRLSLIVFSATVPMASAARPQPRSIQQCVAAEAEREGLSGSILVSQRDKILASVVRGRLAEDASPPIHANTRFNLGSASKMFTAVAIGQLIDQGRLRLDEPVGDVVSGLTKEASHVTIRQLLNHTSGLGDFFRPENMGAMLKARSASDILPLIANDKPSFPPGSKFSYSNSGFALLGIIIERVSGMTYGEYLRRYLFGPSGMESTGLDPKPLRRLAVGMTAGGMPNAAGGPGLILLGPDGKPLKAPMPAQSTTPPMVLIGPDGHPMNLAQIRPALSPAPGATEGYGSPAGGLFSTVEDMRKFAIALMSGKLLRPATAAQFTSSQIEASPAAAGRPARYYGFGFGTGEDAGVRWYGHNGGTLGANAEFSIQPDHQWVISVLSNRDPPTATNIMRWIKALLANPTHFSSCSVQAS
jgi:D-alanyl-D-alanine carboxypeptidase